ncbi:MAG: allantoinase PuuE [Rhodobacteraceae bacterium]|nr:allantoinase PuuE [Paracoccaceae bacterium]
MIDPAYPRDLIGYGPDAPDPQWPGGAKIAVQVVLNYEEGGENNILHGDAASEAFLSEIVGAQAWPGERHICMESIYEYGARRGVWRLLDLFRDMQIPVTLFAVASALQRHPQVAEIALKDGHEICSHGLRWIDYRAIPEDIEREHIEQSIEIQTKVCGERPLGWYTGRTSVNTRRLIAEEGGFLYDADDYSDDLPFWSRIASTPERGHLIVPYTLDANDMRFATPQGFNSGDQFFAYLRDSFDELHREGTAGRPKMMSIGLHCRLVGRPGRLAGLRRFFEHAQAKGGVWFTRRLDIARHWRATHPYQAAP